MVFSGNTLDSDASGNLEQAEIRKSPDSFGHPFDDCR